MPDDDLDYRVEVRVAFAMDVPAHSLADAKAVARSITDDVFRHSFGRASVSAIVATEAIRCDHLAAREEDGDA